MPACAQGFRLHQGSGGPVGRQADFVIEGCVDSRSPHEMAASPISRGEPLRDEGPFGDHTGYYTLTEPYPVFHLTGITQRQPFCRLVAGRAMR